MRHQGNTKGDRRRDPMSSVKMICRCDLDQLVADGKFVRQQVKQVESANQKARNEACDRNAQKNKEDPKISTGLAGLGKQLEPHADERDSDGDECDEADKTIEDNGEQ